jgi:ankyrin repeat protein
MKAPSKLVESLLNCDLETAKKTIYEGADINLNYGEAGWTALHYMAEEGVTESAKWLLENGANPNPKDIFGQTPFALGD